MREIDKYLAPTLGRYHETRLATLFGSPADGDALADSGINNVLLADGPHSGAVIGELAEVVGSTFGGPVDIVDLHHTPYPITGQALKGRRLLGGEPDRGRTAHQTPRRQRGRRRAPRAQLGRHASRLDAVIFRENVESIRRCVARVEVRAPPDVAGLTANPDPPGIVAFNLIPATKPRVDFGSHTTGDSAVATPRTFDGTGVAFGRLGAIGTEACEAMTSAVGFRNVAVHNYAAINWEFLRAIRTGSSGLFRQLAGKLVRYA